MTLWVTDNRVRETPSVNDPWADLRSQRYAAEAWERMTTGGVSTTRPVVATPYVVTTFQSGHVHTEYLAHAAYRF